MIIDLNDAKNCILHKELSKYIKDKKMIEEVFESEGEHYNLLSYMANKIDNGIIVDIGTHRGYSALALSINSSNKIYTYDIKIIKGGLENNINPIPDNISWTIEEVGGDPIMSDDGLKLLLDANLIFLDIAHGGVHETKIYNYLVDKKYKGILLVDDIHYNGRMKRFWGNIATDKHDLSSVGHSGGSSNEASNRKLICGTGLIDFNNNVEIIGELND
jgi:hypothetical protein